ncbi:MAG: hypothetical protein ACD_2C00234G0008 [uncultured bacterium (gcode 4)]|uniref:UmuC domain-containing protein n=1 Tax=uncultured bacterium (gcode 4) TaxID=1234023 RepID=K2FD84_9BACT|nr:MAG: hypothetical protein ACD_2C00234G0008 [uncultured bacterium (gcode 4)]
MKFNSSNKVYAHVDCNSFFASCEMYRNPSLKGKCVCVGWEIIVAASYEAKRYWVKTWTPVWEARRMLGKEFILIHPDLNFYKQISKRFTTFLGDYSNSIQIFSIDEAFMDITWMAEYRKIDYLEFAIFLKKEIRRCIWIPVSVWIANTKIKAKIFSDINKPFWECVAFEDDPVSGILSKLKVTETPFIGKKTWEKLQYICKTIEDFRKLSFWSIDEMLGKNWTDLWLELNWVDIMDFSGNPIPKSISRTSSFNKKITNDKDFLWSQIVDHFNQAYFILTKYNLELKNIAIYLRDKDFCRYAYDFNFEIHTNIRTDLLMKLREIFNSKVPFSLEYRSTGVIFSDFKEFVPKQLSLQDFDNVTFEKNKKLMHAIEAVNKFYWKKKVNIGAM